MVTTGGTGPAPRDVTPEATEAVSATPSQAVLSSSGTWPSSPVCLHACHCQGLMALTMMLLAACRCVSA